MKHPPDLNDLYEFLASQDFPLSVRQREQMHDYLQLLNTWSIRLNLVSDYDKNHLLERHFLPSLYLNACLPVTIHGRLMDLGSGAGFPGILIAIMRPGLSVTLLDSLKKKTLFLEEVCDACGLDCHIICQRCETYAHSTEKKYQIIVARAVARLNLLLTWTKDLLQRPGSLFALKGGNEIREIEESKLTTRAYQLYRPGSDWTKFSTYMQNKFVIHLEQ